MTASVIRYDKPRKQAALREISNYVQRARAIADHEGFEIIRDYLGILDADIAFESVLIDTGDRDPTAALETSHA